MQNEQDQEKYWRAHLVQAEKHPKSQMAYCQEAGIEARKLYAFRERAKARGKKLLKSKVDGSGFSPVRVLEAAPLGHNHLPEARWVADLILQLVRGVQ